LTKKEKKIFNFVVDFNFLCYIKTMNIKEFIKNISTYYKNKNVSELSDFIKSKNLSETDLKNLYIKIISKFRWLPRIADIKNMTISGLQEPQKTNLSSQEIFDSWNLEDLLTLAPIQLIKFLKIKYNKSEILDWLKKNDIIYRDNIIKNHKYSYKKENLISPKTWGWLTGQKFKYDVSKKKWVFFRK